MSERQEFDKGQEQSLNERNIAEFRANGGVVGGPFEGFPLLLLITLGAKTGVERVNPLAYFDIEGKTYIVGSAAGRDAHPGWVANVRTDPKVRVEIGTNPRTKATAVELSREERDRIFEIVTQRAPGFAGYQRATDRLIPVFEIQGV